MRRYFGSPVKRKDKPEYDSRKKCDYDAALTFVKLSHEELIMVAATTAGRMNGARDPVKVVIHKGGWSSVDKRGPFFYDGKADSVFVTALKRQLRQDIDVREGDAGLEIPEFARAALDAFMDFHA